MKYALAVIIIIGAFSAVSTMSHTDAVIDQQARCESIKQWNEGRERGISAYDRLGHPAASLEERELCLK